MIKTWENFCPVLFTYHQLFFPSFYGLKKFWIMKFDIKSIFISGFASKNTNFVSQIFNDNGKIKSWV